MRSSTKWVVGVFAFCLLLSPSKGIYAQAAAEQKQPQAKTKAEYDAYLALFNEQDPTKKSELATKFLTDYPDTEFKTYIYQMLINSYAQLGSAAKVIETGEKFSTDVPAGRQQHKEVCVPANDGRIPAAEQL